MLKSSMSILLLFGLPEGSSQKRRAGITANHRSAIGVIAVAFCFATQFRITIRRARAMVTKRFDDSVRNSTLPAPKPRKPRAVRPAHCAVGLAGSAPRLAPSRGHSALIPDASGPLRSRPARYVCLGRQRSTVVGWTCCSLQRTTPFSLSRSARPALRLVSCVLSVVCEP